MRSSLQTQIH